MNRICAFLLVLSALVACVSCDKHSVLTVTPETVVLNATGEGQYVKVNAPGAWTLTTTGAWIKPGLTEGTGVSSVLIAAEPATEARGAVVTVTCGSQKTSIAVSQLGPGGETPGGENPGGNTPGAMSRGPRYASRLERRSSVSAVTCSWSHMQAVQTRARSAATSGRCIELCP